MEDINPNTTIEDLKIFVNVLFNNYDFNKLDILTKIVKVIGNKKDNIEMFIAIISQKIYFKIKYNPNLYTDFEPIIIQFLNWQLKYKLSIQSYIIYTFQIVLAQNKISDNIKNILELIIKDREIKIDEVDLKSIYKILDYGLNEVIEILYQKLISKKEDGIYYYHFTRYFNHYDFFEDSLIASYITSYNNFKFLVDKALNYCSTPIKIIKDENGKKYEFKIHLDYFLNNAIKQEYIEQLFTELQENNDIKTIQILYIIVPVSATYLNVIVQNLNLLEDEVSEEDLMNYLRQVGKIKSWSRSHMQNSDLVLNEEALFQEIYNRVDSLSLQLKLKEELKYIEIRKRKEIEEDIAHLLDK
jgi:hypothetical protein